MNNILSVLDSFTFELYLLYQNNLSPGTKILGLCYYIGCRFQNEVQRFGL